MKKYLIYTTEGYCEDPHGDEICNCQVLGRVTANDKSGAIDKFIHEHIHLFEIRGFSPYCVNAAQLDNSETIY